MKLKKTVNSGKKPSKNNDKALPIEPTYVTGSSEVLAFQDFDFLAREDLRSVRLGLEYLKADTLLKEWNVNSTIVVFGSARIPSPEHAAEAIKKSQASKGTQNKERHQTAAQKLLAQVEIYQQARAFAYLVSQESKKRFECTHICRDFVICTGGGPGVMEAANRGATEAKSPSIGFNIILPHEQHHNPYLTPSLNFRFHYFALRKMHFMLRARALVFFPGGFGTLDELFEALTLLQTGKVKPMPVILFHQKFWDKLINFNFLVQQGMISAEDLKLIQFVEKPEQAWEIITRFYDQPANKQ
jgi:hypothetical protein